MYALESCSATAEEAAWANWFPEPTTKELNVYLGFRAAWGADGRRLLRRPPPSRGGGAVEAGPACPSGITSSRFTLVNRRSSRAPLRRPR